MSHCQHSERISAFHDGELDAISAQQVQEHLSQCADCRRILRELDGLSNFFATATALQSAEPSKELIGRLHAAIDALPVGAAAEGQAEDDDADLAANADDDFGSFAAPAEAAPAVAQRPMMRLTGASTAARKRTAGILGVAGWLSAAAASLLIIGTAWLLEMPTETPRPAPQRVEQAAIPEWERLATTLQPDPLVLPDNKLTPDRSQSQDVSLADWILSSLAPRKK